MCRFTETTLPDITKFYNTLTGEDLSKVDYRHAQTIWQTFNIQNLREYHNLYVTPDVLLLADIFENLRKMCQSHYHLDPLHYYTSPGLSWDAMLLKTGVQLELLTDLDQHRFIEAVIRGGVAMICKKCSKANNPYVKDYDPDKETSWLQMWDINNLYGYGMQNLLPKSTFQWLSEEEVNAFQAQEVSDDSETGYMCEVDLEYPHKLHDTHSDYPLAPDSLTITHDMLSSYSKDLLTTLGMKPGKVPKLIPNLRNKEKCILHYINLKQYLSLELKLTKVHRVLAFHQSAWLKAYIDFNTEKRKMAKNDFDKDFFKLLNNSIYGRTLEDLRKHVYVEKISSREKLRKVLAKPNMTSFRIFDNNIVAVEIKKSVLKLSRPCYVGMAILDLSKSLMYDFYYGYLKRKYGQNVSLCMTDTDSFLVEVNRIYLL